MSSRRVSAGQRRADPIRWRIVILLTIGIVIAYIDRINLSGALPEIRKNVRLSPESSGLLLSAFFWSYALVQVPAGWLVDRFGVKWPYAISFLLWSVISAATAAANTFAGLISARILLGLGEAVVVPASMRYIRANFDEEERGLPVGFYFAGTKYGPAIGAPLATYLVLAYGWRLMFIVTGSACLIWLLPWLFFVKRDSVNPTVQFEITADSSRWRDIVSTPVMWGTFLGSFCYNYFVYFCMTWMPTYFKESHGLSLTDSGWFTFMSFGGMATTAILGGYAADRLIARGRNPVSVRKGFTIIGFVLAFSEILGAVTDSASVSLFVAVFSLIGLGLATANYWALTQTLMPPDSIGRVSGIQDMAASLGGIAAPWITGILIERTGAFTAPLVAIAFWLAIGLSCYIFLVKEKYAPRLAAVQAPRRELSDTASFRE